MDAVEKILHDISTPANKPPGFDGHNYTFWRFKMENFIKAHGLRIWDIIENGNFVPKDAEDKPKTKDQFTEEDYTKV